MSIKEIKGNIFKAKTQAIVNPVNIMGIMGAGIALQVKKKFPEVFESYKKACYDKSIINRGYHVYRIRDQDNLEYIINLPTKKHYFEMSDYFSIEKSIETLISIIYSMEIRSISIPALGCGCGGLNWNIVRTIIKSKMEILENVSIYLYSPRGKK